MSEANTPVGSMDRRVAIQPSMPGYMAWNVAASVRESLEVYSRPPNSGTRASSPRRNSDSPALIGKSTQTSQPAMG